MVHASNPDSTGPNIGTQRRRENVQFRVYTKSLVPGKFVGRARLSRAEFVPGTTYPSPSISAEHFRPGVFARSKGTNLLAAK